jgi:hypothetical protein
MKSNLYTKERVEKALTYQTDSEQELLPFVELMLLIQLKNLFMLSNLSPSLLPWSNPGTTILSQLGVHKSLSDLTASIPTFSPSLQGQKYLYKN